MRNKSDIRYAEVKFNDDSKNEAVYYPRDAYFQKDANAFVVIEETKDGPILRIYPREIVKSFEIKYEEGN